MSDSKKTPTSLSLAGIVVDGKGIVNPTLGRPDSNAIENGLPIYAVIEGDNGFEAVVTSFAHHKGAKRAYSTQTDAHARKNKRPGAQMPTDVHGRIIADVVANHCVLAVWSPIDKGIVEKLIAAGNEIETRTEWLHDDEKVLPENTVLVPFLPLQKYPSDEFQLCSAQDATFKQVIFKSGSEYNPPKSESGEAVVDLSHVGGQILQFALDGAAFTVGANVKP